MYFDKQNGQECVHKAVNVKKCGTDHLSGNSATENRAAYETCIKALKLPVEFESEALSLQASDFTSPTVFESAYNRKIGNYVEKIDGMFVGPAKENTMEFSINWLALLLLPLAFCIVYFINRPASSTISSTTTVSPVSATESPLSATETA